MFGSWSCFWKQLCLFVAADTEMNVFLSCSCQAKGFFEIFLLPQTCKMWFSSAVFKLNLNTFPFYQVPTILVPHRVGWLRQAKDAQFFLKVAANKCLINFTWFLFLPQIGKGEKCKSDSLHLWLDVKTLLTLQNWRWCYYGNCCCCSHLWGAWQVRYLKNFWCMPKLPLWESDSLFICIWGRWQCKSPSFERSGFRWIRQKQTYFLSQMI